MHVIINNTKTFLKEENGPNANVVFRCISLTHIFLKGVGTVHDEIRVGS